GSPASVPGSGRLVSATDRAPAGVSSADASLGAWIGALIGEAEGVLAVWFTAGDGRSGRALHRVVTVLAGRDPALRAAHDERASVVARKFPEFAFAFEATDRAGPPSEAARLV